MKKNYTKKEIWCFRNGIPITTLVLDILKIPSNKSYGYSRFRCPLCGIFNLVALPDRNIALCTDCETEFNPIDIVMKHKNVTFKPAIDFLDALQIV
ncbi:MAG: hypothetical protein KKE62_05985 [Proteobacteria bacterium]|nr:hypothetical protein [Pseudomonadota bacterium]MBU1542377.1 hypothetical protein [Pseudomonadota bacterium]